jgi:hypothetical protein
MIVSNEDVFFELVKKLKFSEMLNLEETAKIYPEVIEQAWKVLFNRDYPNAYQNSLKDPDVFKMLDESSVNPERRYYKRYYEYMKRLEPYLEGIDLTFAVDYRESSIVVGVTGPFMNYFKANGIFYIRTGFAYYQIDFKKFELKIVPEPENKQIILEKYIISDDCFFLGKMIDYGEFKMISFIAQDRIINYTTDETAPLLISYGVF